MVLHRGRMVEEGRAREVLASPLHPYTQRLVASIPDLDRRRTLPQSGAPRDLQAPADEGCSYRARCQGAVADCASARGGTVENLGDRSLRCWRSREVAVMTPIDLPAPVEERADPSGALRCREGLSQPWPRDARLHRCLVRCEGRRMRGSRRGERIRQDDARPMRARIGGARQGGDTPGRNRLASSRP